MKRAVLFDLDDTLMPEEAAAVAAFDATAELAGCHHDVDVDALAAGARGRGRRLWYSAPTHGYCMQVGISSWEGLWCRFEGDWPEALALREWAPEYRRETWRLALADQGVDDPQLAERLGNRFVEERRGRHQVFGEVVGVLERLKQTYSMALVTNGAACLQREKLAASDLGEYFDVVVVSADLGIAKPNPLVFEHALTQLGINAADAVMVGDSISKDVDGAVAAGLEAIWLNRAGSPVAPDRPDLVEISTLRDLPQLLKAKG